MSSTTTNDTPIYYAAFATLKEYRGYYSLRNHETPTGRQSKAALEARNRWQGANKVFVAMFGETLRDRLLEIYKEQRDNEQIVVTGYGMRPSKSVEQSAAMFAEEVTS